MKLENLKVFLQVVSVGSMTKAAQTLCMSEQNVSKIIGALENETEKELFIKTPQGCQLTEAGEVFYKFAENTIDYFQLTIDQMKNSSSEALENEFKGKIRMIISSGLSNLFLEEYRTFSKKYSNAQFSVISYDLNYLCNHFSELSADIVAFTISEKLYNDLLPDIEANYMVVYRLAEPLSLIAHEQFPKFYGLNEDKVLISDLQAIPKVSFTTDMETPLMTDISGNIMANRANTNIIDFLWSQILSGDTCLIGLPLFAQLQEDARKAKLVYIPIDGGTIWYHVVLKNKSSSKLCNHFLTQWQKNLHLSEIH